ncbi:MAG: gliding motility-associated C-terminal domain-containing protein [Flavobacteriales bacterium]|nr:gliding motility-associated C-terminal domain-containing protein [Flavobacteriales bacterium]
MLCRAILVLITIYIQFVAHPQIVVPANGCVMEDFDASNPWNFGGTNSSWTYANPNKLQISDDITGGGKCLILGGNTPTSTYNSNEDSWARSPIYDFSLITDPYLEFYFYWSNEGSTSYDEIWMEYSTNGGASWLIVSPPAGSGGCYDQNWYNYPDNWGGNVGGCFSGSGGPTNWVVVRKCIASLGGLPQVEFRFRITTGTQCNNYGATIDNWSICDASINASATVQCTGNFGEYDFLDWSYPCPDQWLWDFGDGTTSNQQFPNHTYSNSGSYTVTLTTTSSSAATSGCGSHTDTYSMTVTVLDSVSIDYPSTTICTSDSNISPIVTGSNLGSFTSSPTGLTINSSTGDLSPYSSSEGIYTINFIPNTNCDSSASTTIEVESGASVLPTPDMIFCNGDIATIPDFVSQPTGLTTNWSLISGSDLGFGSSGTGNVPSFAANNQTTSSFESTYEVIADGSNSCPSVPDTFNIIIGYTPNSDFIGDSLHGCSPLHVNFYSSAQESICLWDFGNGITSSSCDSVTQTFEAGSYDISYSVTTSDGCSSSSIYSDYITSYETSNAQFSYNPQLVTIENSELTMINSSTFADQYFWEVEGQNGFYFSSTEDAPIITLPGDTSVYTICLYTTNANSCGSEYCEILEVLNVLSFFIPNSFTPNGDGINEYFGPVFSGIEPSEYSFLIFDRWGTIVFEADNINTLWNGNMNSQIVPEGTYIWKLNYKEAEQLEFKNIGGHVNLIR